MIIVLGFCAILLFISALLVIWRIAKGPSSLDRMVGLDMMTSVLIGAFALLAAATRRADLLPVFVVLAIVGFVGSTTMARFAKPADPADRRILTKDEEKVEDLKFRARTMEGAAPLHDVDREEAEDYRSPGPTSAGHSNPAKEDS